jgi:hypothetical protein
MAWRNLPGAEWMAGGASGSGGGATWSRAQSKIGGKRAQLDEQMNGGRWASGARPSKGARARERGRRTRSRGHVHGEGRGREVGVELTGGSRETERERERACGKRNGAGRSV